MANNHFSFEELSKDIAQEISAYLNNNEMSNLVKTNKQISLLFKEPLQKRLKDYVINEAAYQRQKEVEKVLQIHPSLQTDNDFMFQLLLHHVAFGQEEEAEKLIQRRPELLFMKDAMVTDYSGRTFKTNPIRYALWAKDTYMLSMLLFYLTPLKNGLAYAKHQFTEHEKHGVTYVKAAHGQKATIEKEQHFDLSPLIHALDRFIKNFDVWESEEECKKHWNEEVGELQKEMVAHIAQHYCDSEDSAIYTFKKQKFKRCLNFYDEVHRKDAVWFPLSNSSLGIDFAILGAWCSWNQKAFGVVYEWRPYGNQGGQFRLGAPEYELTSIRQLCQVKEDDLTALKNYLKDPMNNPLPNHLNHKPLLDTDETMSFDRRG